MSHVVVSAGLVVSTLPPLCCLLHRMEAPLRKRGRSDAAATSWTPGEPNPANEQPTFKPPAALGAPAIAEYKSGQLIVKLSGKASPRLPKGVWDTLVGLLGDGKDQDGGHAAVPRTAWRFSSSRGIESAAFPVATGAAEAGAQLGGTGAAPSQQQQQQQAPAPRVPSLYLAVSLDGRAPVPVDGNAVDEGEKRRQHLWLKQLRVALAAVVPDIAEALSRVTLHACSVYTPAPGQVLLLLDVSTWTKEPSAAPGNEEDADEGEQPEAAHPSQKKQVRCGRERPTIVARQGHGWVRGHTGMTPVWRGAKTCPHVFLRARADLASLSPKLSYMTYKDFKSWLPSHFVRVAVGTCREARFRQGRTVKPLTL